MNVGELIKILQTQNPNKNVRARCGSSRGTFGDEISLRLSNHKYYKGDIMIEGSNQTRIDLTEGDPTPQDLVSISREEYNKLLKRDDWLGCLEAAGVDSWDGVDEAIDIKNSEEMQ